MWVFSLCQVLSCFSRVQLFSTPWTVAHQAPPSMEFSRQEYWSGLPFPSPGGGVFLTQGLNPGLLPCLLHRRWFLYHLSHQGSPKSLVPSQNVCVLGLMSWEWGPGGENFTGACADSCTLTSHTLLPAVFNFGL